MSNRLFNVLYKNILSKNQHPYKNALLLDHIHTTSIKWKDFYELLGLTKDATQSQIKSSYYEKAKHLHPDTGQSKDASDFHELTRAYETLSDIQSKIEYDKSLNNHNSRTPNHDPFEWAPRPPKRSVNMKDRNHQEPINMNHIQFVYKTINREDLPETPVFRPFENHHYSNSDYNRFEFDRVWDKERKAWAYQKKPLHIRKRYEEGLRQKFGDLQLIIAIIMVGSLLLSLYQTSYPFIKRKERIPYDDIVREFVLPHDDLLPEIEPKK